MHPQVSLVPAINNRLDGNRTMNSYQSLPPEQIQAHSFEIIGRLLPDFDQSSPSWPIVRRMVHAAGDPSVAQMVRVHPDAVSFGVGALLAGRPILTDVRMVAAGIIGRFAGRLGCQIICANDQPGALTLEPREQMTRSAAAMVALSERIPGSIVAIGNAPTALFALLELLRDGLEPPALIIGTPVGFVGAAESKLELVSLGQPKAPYVTVEGTRGGSAMAAAAANALLVMATTELDRGTAGSGGRP